MKAVILAAGQGSRLGQGSLPKPLTPLATGKSILEHQLEALSQYISLDDVLVVVGYRKEEIMETFPDLLYVYNPRFAEENTSKSLFRALKKCSEDVLWLNGDVVFHSSILKALFESPKTSMIVNVAKVGEEEVKYRQDAHGKILEVSKMVKNPKGEALGINYCTANDLGHLCKGLERCIDSDYFEKGIEFCINEGMAVWSVAVDGELCTEVDFPEDLKRANAILTAAAD